MEMQQAKGKVEENPKMETKNNDNNNTTKDGTSSLSFKFNAQAPEFVPRTHTHQVPISGYFYPYFHYFAGSTGGSDWIYVGGDQDSMVSSTSTVVIPNYSKDVLTQELQDKIIRQVEYQFSGMSLLANESLVKQINKDPEGYVPISVIASTKKIKSLINNNNLLAQALRSSSKLVVSSDGKKVRRKDPFNEREKEELQSRTVVAENLPEDHSHQNLKKIFSVVGSVKTIRICHPQESNSSRAKGDFVISNKLHALVEYETTDIAEKAVEKLNDERNWRKGLRVRLLLRCSPKSVLKRRKSDFDGYFDDDEVATPELSEESSSQPSYSELPTENNGEESSGGSRKGWGRGRGKSRSRSQAHNGCGPLTSPSSSSCDTSPKQVTRGPRMPDGTRGFTMGRGKPLSVIVPPPTSVLQ